MHTNKKTASQQFSVIRLPPPDNQTTNTQPADSASDLAFESAWRRKPLNLTNIQKRQPTKSAWDIAVSTYSLEAVVQATEAFIQTESTRDLPRFLLTFLAEDISDYAEHYQHVLAAEGNLRQQAAAKEATETAHRDMIRAILDAPMPPALKRIR